MACSFCPALRPICIAFAQFPVQSHLPSLRCVPAVRPVRFDVSRRPPMKNLKLRALPYAGALVAIASMAGYFTGR
jgi:hypothetical protein